MALELNHWEYSFLLHTSHLGDTARTGTNPFTGESVSFPVDNGLNDDEIDAVQEVLDQYGAEGPFPDAEGYQIDIPEDDYLRLRCNDLDSGEDICTIQAEANVTRLTDAVLQIFLDIARAGNLLLMSSVGDNVLIVDRSPPSDIRERWPDVRTITAIHELRTWLEETIGGRQTV